MKAVDITGQKFGLLTAIEACGVTADRKIKWRFLCDCGKETVATAKSARCGNTKSCGCLGVQRLIERNAARAEHGMTGTQTHTAWINMRERCLNPNHKSYHRYGGRGILICARWLESFVCFLEDMGEPPAGMSLDRIDSDGNYEPSNCRWATNEEQSNNRSTNVFIEHDGQKKTIAQWAREVGMSRAALRHRLKSGWSPQEALTMKLDRANGQKRVVQ